MVMIRQMMTVLTEVLQLPMAAMAETAALAAYQPTVLLVKPVHSPAVAAVVAVALRPV